MQSKTGKANERLQGRRKAVLPVRVRGKDSSGRSFEELAHTLDVTPSGVRLGGIRHELGHLERLTVAYRQRRMEFEVVWTKKLDGVSEYQVGLRAISQDGDAWGFNPADFKISAEAPVTGKPGRSLAPGAA
jgi:hypothetical protein